MNFGFKELKPTTRTIVSVVQLKQQEIKLNEHNRAYKEYIAGIS